MRRTTPEFDQMRDFGHCRLRVDRSLVIVTCPAHLNVRGNDLGKVEMAASLDLLHFHPVVGRPRPVGRSWRCRPRAAIRSKIAP
jgi:hypothetical protein